MDLTKLNKEELNELIENLNVEYEEIKKNILTKLDNIENIENEVNLLNNELSIIENIYVNIIKELKTRE